MQFTTQQIQGGPRYSQGTKIGNWNEDRILEEVRLNDYLERKKTKNLAVYRKQAILEKAFTPTTLTEEFNGDVLYGSKVMLHNSHSRDVIIISPHMTLEGKDYNAVECQADEKRGSYAYNTFVIEKLDFHSLSKNPRGIDFTEALVKKSLPEDDNILRFGIPFRLTNTQELSGTPYYLTCEINQFQQSTQDVIPNSSQVFFTSNKHSNNTLWVFQHIDPSLRHQAQGFPIKYAMNAILVHYNSNKPLANNHNQVYCYNHTPKNKVHVCVSESLGFRTGDESTRVSHSPNMWCILGQESVSPPHFSSLSQETCPGQ